jgi:hypothetical protein
MKGAAEFWRTLLNYDAVKKSYVVSPLLSLTEDLFEASLLDALIDAKWTLTDAYWGRAEEACEKSSYCLTQLDPSGTAMCEQNKSFYYFLTSYSSFTMVPVSMVLQSVGNDIKVFPAVPKAFSDIAFHNLPATDGIRVSGEMKNGKVQYVRFEKNGKVLLETTDGKTPVVASEVNGRLVLKK